MLSRRELLETTTATALAAAPGARMFLCMHQATSAGAGYAKSLEGYARAGFRFVELIPPHYDEFIRKDGVPAAKRILSDLGLKAVSSGGVRGLAEPSPDRPKALEELRRRAERLAELGIDRMVCPCNTTQKFTLDDYKRAVDNLREAGEIVKPLGVVAMLEFMRGSTFIGTLPTALRVLRDTNHPNVRLVFDFYHFWAGLSRLEDLELLKDFELHHVHFQDTPNIPRELLDATTREVPGDGVAPLVRMLQVLHRKGYSGPLSVELFLPRMQQGDPYQAAMEIQKKSVPILRQAGVL